MTFEQAAQLFASARKGYKPLENNTKLVKVDDNTFGVKLHATNVVLIHRDGTYTLNTGGWQTVTTKDRLNKYSPASVYQKNRLWYVADGHRFAEGMKIDAHGNLA